MTTTTQLRLRSTPRWTTGRSELIVVAGLLALAIFLTVGTVTMDVPEDVALPGPQFFPAIVTGFIYVIAIALTIIVFRAPRRTHVVEDPTEISDEMLQDLGGVDETRELSVLSPEEMKRDDNTQEAEQRGSIDWKTLAIAAVAMAGFIVILPFVGWLISAAALFWVLAWAFGSKRPLFDIGVAIILSSGIQLAFGAGLGLAIPSGFMEGLF